MNTLYYDYEPDGSKRPIWLTIPFEYDNEKNNVFYANVKLYQTEFVGDMSDDLIGCSVYLNELTVGIHLNEIGINIDKIAERIGGLSGIERFIIQVSDVVEIMAYSENI